MNKVKKVIKSIINDEKFPNDVVVLLSFYDENNNLVLSEKRLTIDGNIDLQDILMHKSICCGLDINNLIIQQN
jgi:hypothetical protein